MREGKRRTDREKVEAARVHREGSGIQRHTTVGRKIERVTARARDRVTDRDRERERGRKGGG